MVRLKINKRKKNEDDLSELARTDCVYAPYIYNQLVSDVNNKKQLLTRYREKFTEEHVNEIMKKIRLIDKSIPKPVYVKRINDTKLKIETREVNVEMLDDDGNYYEQPFYKIFITRKFGNTNLLIWVICCLPANIDPSDIAQIEQDTGASSSSDIASSTMLYRIFKFFNEGRLLESYVPPYYNKRNNRYIEMPIHFNRIKTIEDWKFNEYGRNRRRKDLLKMFKHYASEVNEYHNY